MPTPYIKKVAKKHHASVQSTEEKWAKAKRIASQEGKAGNYAYVTGVFKKMSNESSLPTFKSFLMVEADVESSSGQAMQLTPNVDSDDETNGDVMAPEAPHGDDMNGGEQDMGDEQGGPGGDFGHDFNLESDERFQEMMHAAQAPGGGDPKAQGMVNRLRTMSQSASPEEVEHELQTTWERMFGNQGVHMSAPDDMHHLGNAGMGESLLSQLTKSRK